MRIAIALGPALFLAATAFGQTATYKEPHRPQFHFTPAINWTNDPNGCKEPFDWRSRTF